MRLLIIIGTLLLFTVSCQDTPEIELPEQVGRYVVEGWVTDLDGKKYVKVSRTNSFLSVGSEVIIKDASVSIIDGIGNQFICVYNEDSELYETEINLSGIVGRSYSVEVILNTGDTLISINERLLPVHEINDVSYDFYSAPDEDNPGDDIFIYYPVIFATDPVDEQNFYRWNIYNSDSLFQAPEDIVLLEDRFINGSIYKNEFTSFEFMEGDSIGVEVMSLNRPAFEYLNFLKNQTVSLGTSSASSPGPIEGNIINISSPEDLVLGYFGTSSVKRTGIKIVQ